MNLNALNLIRVEATTLIKPFDCGNQDLNEFLLNDAIKYEQNLLAATFVIENEEKTIAYFSIFNDSIKVEDLDGVSKTQLKKILSRIVPFGKRHLKHFPALKIGRLGVCVKEKRCGLGGHLVKYIINLAIEQNKTCACKFVSVDAYADAVKFYEKFGFDFFTPLDENKETRQMYLDLTPLINTVGS